MSEEQVTTKSVAIKYGLILATVSFVYGLILQYTGQSQGPLGYLGFIISIVFLVLGMKEFRGHNDGYMTFGQGFGLGFLMSIISGFLSAVLNFLYFSFIDGSPLESQLAATREQMENQPGMTDEALEVAMSFTETMVSPGGIAVATIIAAAIGGAILSLIVAAIMKKNAPDY